MDDLKEEIELLKDKSKKNSKLNKNETAEAVTDLSLLLTEDKSNLDYVVDTLVELNYAVTEVFFESIFPTLEEQCKTDIINQFLLNEKIKKNAANFGINRGLIIINALLGTGNNDKHLHNILKFCAKRAYGKDSYQKAGELLIKTCFKKTEKKLFLVDYSTWQESELRTLSAWIEVAISKTKVKSITDAHNDFLDKYNLPKVKKTEMDKETGTEAKGGSNRKPQKENDKSSTLPKEKIIRLINDIQLEASNLLQTVEASKSTIEKLNNEKMELDKRILNLVSTNNQLKAEIEEHLQKISDNENKINELNVRLMNAFDADKAQQNFELISLKNDLVRRLKIDYEDYKILATKESNLQYYEALLGIIESIFDTLGKKGIVLNKNLGV